MNIFQLIRLGVVIPKNFFLLLLFFCGKWAILIGPLIFLKTWRLPKIEGCIFEV